MLKKIKFLLFIFLLVNITFSYANNISDAKSVEAWLQDQVVIRTYDDGAPGFGNQAATINAMNRMRELGFKGRFEYIYRENPNKIAILFNLPSNITPDYLDETRNIRFITFKEYYNLFTSNNLKATKLSIVGGGGDIAWSMKEEGINTSWDDEIFPYNNDAHMMNTEVAARLTPWMAGDCEGSNSEIYLPQQPIPKIVCSNGRKFVMVSVPSLSEVKKYLKTDAQGKEILEKKPALKTLIDIMENQIANIMPVYGQSINQSWDDPDPQNPFLSPMLGVIAAAKYAQTHSNELNQKALIILVFYDYSKEAKIIFNFINNKDRHNNFVGKENAIQAINQLKIANGFDIADVNEPDAINKMLSLKAGNILLLSVGPLPKIIFDGLYNVSTKNIWPQIREGENTFNTLLLTGKPHIRISSAENFWEPSEIGFGPEVFDQSRNLDQKYNHFVFASHVFWVDFQPDIMLGNYILDSQDASSDLSKYFVWLKEQAQKKENDRIYSLLEEAMSSLSNDKK